MPTYGNIPDFIKHLEARIATLHGAQKRALKHAAETLEEEAKSYIGHYEHPGSWPPLTDATMTERVRAGFSANEPLLRTGALRDSIEHRVISPVLAEVGTNDPKAVFHEYGTSKMPPRPIFGPAVAQKKDAIAHEIGKRIVRHLVTGR